MSFLKNIWKANSRHEKLSEELALQNIKDCENELLESDRLSNENDVVTFKLKYLGSTIVEKTIGENINVEAVKNILKVVKAQRKKIPRVNLAISLKGVAVTDLQGNDILKISIYRISNCSTDAAHPQIFSFTSTDATETTECHAFSCTKRKLAETVALTVAHAFTTAYEAWRILPSTKEFQNAMEHRNPSPLPEEISSFFEEEKPQEKEEKLIELDEDPSPLIKIPRSSPRSRLQMQLQRPWVSFDDEMVSKNINLPVA
ncbi:Phosphotyrosine interaction domain (PTB/PID) [Popillia japonica]|uniref:Phosphotyrosine interaction domain (PTB/PID) n=1 Tax=Popillia japonica TaxID=7064 RepID=A0AAW1ITL2_POPJA